jgi:nitroimidazol reductase NimA-like FMN-containing flavoprotein (pyridoxamine 5'-phosphate oxidase superfamily)
MMIGELDQNRISNILLSQVIGRIGCCEDNKPYIVPVTYTYDGSYIYGQSLEGLKMAILRKNPHVCFEVDIMTDMRNWESVLVYGVFEELEGEAAVKARNILFNRVLTLMTSSTIHTFGHNESREIEDENRIKPIMYRIKINEMTGRFERS